LDGNVNNTIEGEHFSHTAKDDDSQDMDTKAASSMEGVQGRH
jgi:hypothetical protein